MRIPHVYLAAGWFSPEQKKQMAEAYRVLRKLRDKRKIKLFAPFYNGIVLKPKDPNPQAKMKKVWDLDIEKIEISDLVVACSQGHDVGTIFECGYASALKEAIICYNSQPEYGLNLMLAQGVKRFVKTEKDLQSAVENYCTAFAKKRRIRSNKALYLIDLEDYNKDMKDLRLTLKNKYNLAIGELSLEELRRKVIKISKAKIKVSGRSYEAGKKKTIEVPICEFWK